MELLYYPKCSTCQRARRWLEERGYTVTLRDLKEAPPTVEELRLWWGRSGLPLKRWFNTSGLSYRALQLKDRLPQMGEEEQLTLLSQDGMLVKRPVLVGEDMVLLGFREAQWQDVLGAADQG